MMTIRKFTSRDFTMDDLIDRGMLTTDQAEQLVDAVCSGDNLLISGGTGAGKTTLANVIAGFIPDADRILILEDVAELSIRKPHVISAEAQLDTHKSQIGFADLLRAALRHRPDRIIVGEIRGVEARVFVDALNTGHRGSLTTIHANGAEDALHRLAQLALRGSGGVSLNDVEEECRRSIDIVIHVAKINGVRAVQELVRIRTS
jgi:pilus assembly protein CpaF